MNGLLVALCILAALPGIAFAERYQVRNSNGDVSWVEVEKERTGSKDYEFDPAYQAYRAIKTYQEIQDRREEREYMERARDMEMQGQEIELRKQAIELENLRRESAEHNTQATEVDGKAIADRVFSGPKYLESNKSEYSVSGSTDSYIPDSPQKP